MMAMLPVALFSSTIMQAVGAVTAIAGPLMQGMNANAQAKSQATVLEQNARAARMQASVREDVQRQHNREKLGVQRAAVAQSGFDPNTGSLLELQGDSAAGLEFDTLATRYEGTLQSLSLENDARQVRAQGKAARNQGYLNAAGSLFGSLGRYGGGGQIPAPVETRGFQGYGGRY